MGNQPWSQFQNGIRERSIGMASSPKVRSVDIEINLLTIDCSETSALAVQ